MRMKKGNTIVYEIGEVIYINLTNRCSNNCDFCIRNDKEKFHDYYLWLEKEPTAKEIIAEINKKYLLYDDFVFCGFGEPLYRLNEIVEVATFLKSNKKNVRLNTNGQADQICVLGDSKTKCGSEMVAKQLKNLVDVISISLNAPTATKYQAICRCVFGEEGFYSMLRFAKACKDECIKVILSVVDCISKQEIVEAKKIASEMGIALRVREYIDN